MNTTEREEIAGPYPNSIAVRGRDLRPGERITVATDAPLKTVAECGTRTVEPFGLANVPHEIVPDRFYVLAPAGW